MDRLIGITQVCYILWTVHMKQIHVLCQFALLLCVQWCNGTTSTLTLLACLSALTLSDSKNYSDILKSPVPPFHLCTANVWTSSAILLFLKISWISQPIASYLEGLPRHPTENMQSRKYAHVEQYIELFLNNIQENTHCTIWGRWLSHLTFFQYSSLTQCHTYWCAFSQIEFSTWLGWHGSPHFG